jgi:hypothetical protein
LETRDEHTGFAAGRIGRNPIGDWPQTISCEPKRCSCAGAPLAVLAKWDPAKCAASFQIQAVIPRKRAIQRSRVPRLCLDRFREGNDAPQSGAQTEMKIPTPCRSAVNRLYLTSGLTSRLARCRHLDCAVPTMATPATTILAERT